MTARSWLGSGKTRGLGECRVLNIIQLTGERDWDAKLRAASPGVRIDLKHAVKMSWVLVQYTLSTFEPLLRDGNATCGSEDEVRTRVDPMLGEPKKNTVVGVARELQ